MSESWTYSGKVAALDSTSAVVTLVDESTFAISVLAGDMLSGTAQGLFVRDTRIVSRFELRVNGARPESLSAITEDPFSATFVSRCQPPPGRADSTLMVFRSRHVGQGMREDISVRNFGDEPTFCSVELFVDSDFADMKNGSELREGGAILAAEFLREFTGEGPWAHFDIAGPAFIKRRRPDYALDQGGTGYGVRLIVELAQRLS